MPLEDLAFILSLLRPAYWQILRAVAVIAVAVCLLAAVPLAVNDIREALSHPVANINVTHNVDIDLPGIVAAATPAAFQQAAEDLLSDVIAVCTSEMAIIVACGKLLALLLAHSLISFIGHYLAEVACTSAGNLLRRHSVEAVLNLDYSRFLDRHQYSSSATLVSHINDSITAVHSIMSESITNLTTKVVETVVAAIALFAIAPRLAAFLVTAMASWTLFSEYRRIYHHRRRRRHHHHHHHHHHHKKQQQHNDATTTAESVASTTEDIGHRVIKCQGTITAFVNSAVERLATVRIFKGEELIMHRLESMLTQLQSLRNSSAWEIHGAAGNASRVLLIIGVVGATVVLVLHRRGYIDMLDFSVVGFLAKQLVSSFDAAHQIVRKFFAGELGKLKPLVTVLRQGEEDAARGKEMPAPPPLPAAATADGEEEEDDDDDVVIRCNGVSASYPGTAGPPVLVDFSIKPVRRGDIVVFRGNNGHGKSTALRVACGLLPPTTSGDDKQQQQHHHQKKSQFGVRGPVVLLEQAPVLISGLTIAENIAMRELPPLDNNNNNALSDYEKLPPIWKRVRDAAKKANIDSFIMSIGAGGYNLVISSSGGIGSAPVSGGQLARICVARMLMVEDFAVALLDEPTNNIDAESKEIIMDAVKEACCRGGGKAAAAAAAVIVTHDTSLLGSKFREVEFVSGVSTEKERHQIEK